MRLALLVAVAVGGVVATTFIAARMWRASRAGAPREQLLGYMALMVATSAVSLLVLRAL